MRIQIWTRLFLLCCSVALAGCGDSDSSNDASPTPNTGGESGDNGEGTDDGENDAPVVGTITDGKYYLSAGSFEAFDNAGNKIDGQPLQVTGEYIWTVVHQGDESYELTATGSAKISANNEILAEINCRGAQDIYSFQLQDSGAMRDFTQLEAGCPQESQITAAQQMSITVLNASSFKYTVVTQSEGSRVIEDFTFRM